MINSNDGSYLNKSEWENEFDLVKSLNSTTAAVRNPLLRRRVLPDDTDIVPSPVSSQIGSQDVEMTSKSSFMRKNAPVSIVVSPKKKKVVDITNSKQEDWSHINKAKGGLFKKSKGKENRVDLFDVGYAESDISVVSEKAKKINQTDDSIVSDFTDTIDNAKENLFKKGKQSNGFLNSDDSDDEIIIRRDKAYESMHVSITNPGLHLAPKENTNVSVVLNKSIGLVEKIKDETENIDDIAPVDASFTQNGLTPLPKENNDSSISTNLSLTPCHESKKLNLFSRKKRISFNEPVSSSTNEEEKKVVEEHPSMSETASPFVVPKSPISRRRRKKANVTLEEPVSSSGSEKNSKKVEENLARKSVFARKSRKNFDFQVEFEKSESEQEPEPPLLMESSPSRKRPFYGRKKKTNFNAHLEERVTNSGTSNRPSSPNQKTKEVSFSEEDFENDEKSVEKSLSDSGSARAARKSVFARKSRKADFQVDFEKTASTPHEESKTPDSILSKNNTPAENAARKSVFALKSQKPNFYVDFEKTASTPNEESKTPDSILSKNNTPAENVGAIRKSVFARQSRKPDFQVDFEKTTSTPQEESITPDSISIKENTPSESARAAKNSVFARKTQKLDFEVDFEKTTATPDQGSKTPDSILSRGKSPTESARLARKSVFARKSQKQDFQVDYEKTETSLRQTPDSILSRGTTPTGSLRKRKEKDMDTFNLFSDSFENTLPKRLFGKKARNDDFNVTFEESHRENDTEISAHDRSTEISKKKSFIGSFQVPPDETDHGNKISTPTVSDRASTIRQNSERISVGSASERSFNVTVIDKTGKSVLAKTSNNSTVLTNDSVGEISYDDGNLVGFLSDADEEEPEPPVLEAAFSPLPEVRPSDNLAAWELKFKSIVQNAQSKTVRETGSVPVPKKKPELPRRNRKVESKTPTRRLKKPADYATKRLYDFLVSKLKPKYKTDAIVRAEEFVVYLCETVQTVIRRKTHQKKLIDELKKEMAKLNMVETTMDFYVFVRNYLPDKFRFKVIPSVRPLTNAIYPPSDIVNPFDKIL